MKAEYVNHYLTDDDVANFARHSFADLAKNFSQKKNHDLIRFLARGMASGAWDNLCSDICSNTRDEDEAHEVAVHLRKIATHWVPFGHPQITLRMQAPIPIRVQSFKHKVGFVESEESRRYISSEPELFIPEYFREKAANVKQGSGDKHPESVFLLERYESHCNAGIDLYRRMIKAGVCPEQARFLPAQGCEVNWVWTGSLYAFANYYNQRSDSHAQKEIQILAEQVDSIIAPLFPVSWAALTKGEY